MGRREEQELLGDVKLLEGDACTMLGRAHTATCHVRGCGASHEWTSEAAWFTEYQQLAAVFLYSSYIMVSSSLLVHDTLVYLTDFLGFCV